MSLNVFYSYLSFKTAPKLSKVVSSNPHLKRPLSKGHVLNIVHIKYETQKKFVPNFLTFAFKVFYKYVNFWWEQYSTV